MAGHSDPRSQAEYRQIADTLIGWYVRGHRNLPWRRDRDPYRVWVSEIMLQQTRVEAVVDYFQRFMDRFPTIGHLAEASEQEVLKAWEGLGYYSRARNLHKAARVIASQYNGIFPAEREAARALPGIGDYTAGAVLSIAYGLPVPAVDGNVLRVLARLDGIEEDVLLPATKADVTGRVQAMHGAGKANELTQGLMELGALVCVPGVPRCTECPLAGYCRAYQTGRQEKLPLRSPRKPQKVQRLCAGLIRCQEGIWIAKRPDTGLLANLWEFPNVVRRRSVRETKEALLAAYGLDIQSFSKVGHVRHVFTHRIWEADVYAGTGTCAGERCRCVPLQELDHYPMGTVFQRMKEWI